MTRDWLLRLHPLSPSSAPDDLTSLLPPGGLALWRRLAGEVEAKPIRKFGEFGTPYDFGDDEDFLEQVWRLHAIAEVIPHERVYVQVRERIRNLATGRDGYPAADAFRWGMQTKQEAREHPIPAEVAADHYFEHSAFQAFAGRRVAISGFRTTGEPQLCDTIRAFAGRTGSAFVKVVRPTKGGITTVPVTSGATDDDILDTMYDDEFFGGALIHAEGRPGTFLVQERVEMRFEYRMFVVDGRVVTGAGCVESFTPGTRRDTGPFDCRVQEYRGRSEVIHAPGVVHTLREGAEAFLAAYTRSGDAGSEFVLDMALDGAGRPLVVEVNGIRNSGLYASDPVAVIAALQERHRSVESAAA
jgi:hypothetical protein